MTDTPATPPPGWKPRPTDSRGYRPGKKTKAVTPSNMGRKPLSWTPEVGQLIIDILRRGNSRDSAAASAGVVGQTFRNWLRRGAKGEEPFASWVIEVNRAEAEAEQDLIHGITAAGYRQKMRTVTTLEKNGKVETTVEERDEPGDARALMWKAERLHSRNWSIGIIERRSKEQDEARKAAKGEGKDEGLRVVVQMAEPKQ